MRTFDMLINTEDVIGHINPEIYGHFSEHLGRCIYNGIYVGEDSPIPNTHGIRNDVVEAFRNIKMPVIRWPGGCFADEYHWRDGIGEKASRKKMINTNWGGVTEDNSFGTHEFMEFCDLVGCEPYISGNVGSGTVQELSEWVEYITSGNVSPAADERRQNGREEPWKLKYLGIGNENWGCGGNMSVDHYCSLYKQFQTFCKDHSGNHLYKIACGPSGSDYDWTEGMMKGLKTPAGWTAKGISLHFYSVPDWNNKGSALEFDENEYLELLGTVNFTDELITRHSQIMDRYDPKGEVALIVDEWGTWFDVEPGTNPGFLYQQNTMRDAIVAAISLNIFNRHSERVKMANIAQAVNVLQALILTEGEKMIKTPTYHVFDLFKEHQNGDAVYCCCQNENIGGKKDVPMITSSASVKDGVLTITAGNCSLAESADITCSVHGMEIGTVSGRILTNEVHAHNDFDAPDNVKIIPFTAAVRDGKISMKLPPCSVVEVSAR
ncbi:MAG: alpha-N-arabinofuranosidase [Oscillospiraceae bacterium]|nr:alpha-N-arabinofuranosidase [Oscillospiraceae bacterium]MBQ8978409.1 alpha-N-arabinofuranosidase [Oscillospiraceae bacterium]